MKPFCRQRRRSSSTHTAGPGQRGARRARGTSCCGHNPEALNRVYNIAFGAKPSRSNTYSRCCVRCSATRVWSPNGAFRGGDTRHSLAAISLARNLIGYEPTHSLSSGLRSGTGFAVGDGLRIATNEHVLPKTLNSERYETLAIALRGEDGSVQIRPARKLVADSSHDLASVLVKGTKESALSQPSGITYAIRPPSCTPWST